MRKLVVALAVILLALSALALAPSAVPTSYADILPKVIAGVAVLLLVAILADRAKPESAGTTAKVASTVAAAPLANQADSEIVNFLAILQEVGPQSDRREADAASGALYSASRRIPRGRVPVAVGRRRTTIGLFRTVWLHQQSHGCRTRISIPGPSNRA
jgi:hypothetical protein